MTGVIADDVVRAGRLTSRYGLALAAVAIGFAVVQLATMGLGYGLGYDETIYLSQLNPGVPAFPWSSHRAWGMPVFTAPISLVDAPLPGIRLYLVALSSLGLGLAYWPWLAVRDTASVPLAAALFASTYVSVYHGVMALPNFYTALAVVAAAGLFLRCRREGSRWAAVGLAAAVGLTALARPSDSLWLVAGLGVAWLGLAAYRRAPIGLAIGAGLLAGWTPWLIEAAVRFDGPWARLSGARAAVGGDGLHLDLTTLKLYLRMWSAVRLECYTGGGNPCAIAEPINRVTMLWWLAAAALVLLGVTAAVRARRAAESLVPLVVGVSLAFSYLFLLRYGALRFLLPAGAALALPAAGGLLVLARLRPPPARVIGATLAAGAVLAHAGVHLVTADQLGEAANRSRSYYPVLAERSRAAGIAPPCAVFGDAPTVAYELGCEYRDRLRGDPASQPTWIGQAQAQGKAVAGLVRSAPDGSFLGQWRAVPVELPAARSWTIYLPPAADVSNASSSAPRGGR